MTKREEPASAPFPIALVVLAVAVAGLAVWVLSLKSDNAELREQLAELRGSAEPGPDRGTQVDTPPAADVAPTPAPSAPLGPRDLSDSQRQLMLERLGNVPEGPDRKVWFATTMGDEEAARFQGQIAAVFQEAGFEVVRADRVRFPIRPGIYLMIADEEASDAVLDIQAAVELAFPDVTTGRGYRAFYQEKTAEDPSWRGFPMTDDQPYVIAVGRAGT